MEMVSVQFEKYKMADLINFVSKRVIDAKKEEKRKAREQILKKAKEDYEREQRRKERRIESGESSWMLPSLSERLTAEDESNDKDKPKRKKHKKEKKQKKDKKEKKHKKQKNRGDEKSSESESDDEWVEKGTNTSTTDTPKSLSVPSQPQQQHDSWMLCPPIRETSWEPMAVEEDQEQEQTKEEEEDDKMKALSCMDRPGQHPRELNPYWKQGGTGLPTERETPLQESTHREESPRNSFSSSWLKKAYQRAKEEAEEEGKSLADGVAKRYGSVERLEMMISEAQEREAKQRKEESNLSSRERYQGDRDRHDDRKRDRDGRRNKERSPDRYDGRNARSRDSSSDSSYRSARDSEEHKWRRRDDEGRERVKHDSMRFLRPGDSDNRSSFAGKFKRPQSSSSTVTSSTWDFDSKEESRSSGKHSSDKPSSRPSGGWKKKQETGTDKGSSPREEEDAGKESVGQQIKPQSETESSSSSEGEAEEKRTVVIPAKKITEKDLNDIGAKIVKAEIMGNEELAIKLKSQLEEMRKNKELQEAQVKGSGPGERSEEMVVLTRTDASGNVWPLEMNERQEPRGGRRKRKKVETHGKEGTRERYFADDDRYDLKEMVRREKMSTADDQEAMMAKLASKAAKTGYSDDFTLDDRFVSSAANKISPADQEQRAKQRAIREHRMLAAQLSKCRFCFENPEIAKHLIIAIGFKVYLAVPLHESLTDGHCLIIPMQHCSASTMLDEDVCSEIQIYKKGLTKMFEEMEEDVVFLETCKQLRKQHHMIIECVPLPKETGDMAPVYFKKAILESETEWAQNKKLIDTRKKGLRAAVPKGLPYFSVEFGLDGGFAHVIEEEELFPHYFGKEILGGMLDLEPQRWRKPRRENFEEQKRKVLQFADWWKPFDWTQRIERK